MPAKSKSQQALMALAAHGAKFAKAKKLRAQMSHAQLEDFARTPTTSLPAKVRATPATGTLGALMLRKK